ncbi:MAG: mechanosensitive ion channel [Gammaproteobacteria bacterium]|nr:mechanosensitive ion channel [Gammaproteobacteria bacterium]MBQ0839610.1 mechanosensitive ion channel [Gammaproteobacteria bacterium]
MKQELDQFKEVYDLIVTFFVTYSFQLIGALIILLIGLLVSNRVARLVNRTCDKHGLDVTLSRFLASCTKIIIIVAVSVICLGKIGISVTPFIAAIGALSLGAGLAMQGLLSNYGAGFNIILTRPFVVGDTISVQGVTGIVKEVRLAQTILSDEDDVTILIPNRHIVGEIIHNSKEFKVVESTLGVAYGSDIDRVTTTIKGVLHELGVDTNRPPQIGIDELGDSSINFGIRYWLPTGKYHQLRFNVNDQLFKALHLAGIEIPFPQREIRLLKSNDNDSFEK